MELNSVKQQIAYLSRGDLRDRIGLWLVPSEFLGKEEEIAARLGADAIDIREILKTQLPKGTNFVGLWKSDGDQIIYQTLDVISQNTGRMECVLGYNLDLLLAGLTHKSKKNFWSWLFIGFPHRPRAVLLTVNKDAVDLLPSRGIQDSWRKNKYVIV
jgi:hypothetical protein